MHLILETLWNVVEWFCNSSTKAVKYSCVNYIRLHILLYKRSNYAVVMRRENKSQVLMKVFRS